MYIKLTNGTPTKITIGEFRKENPNTSFPRSIPDDTLAAYDVYPCTVADRPDSDERTQKVEVGSITQVNGAWVEGWSVTDKTADEITKYDNAIAANVRSKRDSLLAETDYLALSDNTLSAEMAAYRQALRDITEQEGFPNDVSFPVKPE